jgi:hypothetical protein
VISSPSPLQRPGGHSGPIVATPKPSLPNGAKPVLHEMRSKLHGRAVPAHVAMGSASSPDEHETAQDHLTPPYIIRSALVNYFREAQSPCQFYLWQCDCWTGDTVEMSYSIVFFKKAELGIKAMARASESDAVVDSPASSTKASKTILKEQPPICISLRLVWRW